MNTNTPGGHSSDAAFDDLLSLPSWFETTHECAESHVAPTDGLTKPRKKRATPRSVNISRERRKQELEFLRHHAFELESELNDLQRRRDEILRPHLASDTGELVTTAPVWENMAKRQFQARRKAETETTRLKTLLAAQAQVAQDLINIIQRANDIGQDAGALQSIDVLKEESGTIAEQLERLRILCAQWFVALSWYSQLQTGPLQFFESKVISDDGMETVLDIYSNQSFPFPVADVEDAIWVMFQAECIEDEYAYTQDCEASNDTLIGKFVAASYKDGARSALKGTYVTRRFRNDQGHFLLASSVHATPDCERDALTDKDFVLTEDTWVRILDASELSGVIAMTDSTPTLTVLQHVRRARIRFISADEGGTSRVQTLLNLHLSLVEEELRWGQQNIESMLMRKASAAQC